MRKSHFDIIFHAKTRDSKTCIYFETISDGKFGDKIIEWYFDSS